MVKRIVLTGGPCAGKSTILSKLKQDLCSRGYKVLIVGESATELINGGITPHKDNVGMFYFQKLILSYQYQKEEIYNKALLKSKEENIVIIYDRGLMDDKAYVSTMEFNMILDSLSLEVDKKITEDDLLSRYDMVIHLVTSAGNKGYSLISNNARYESEEEAILLDKRTLKAWSGHNNLHIVRSFVNFDDKVKNVLDIVNDYLVNEGLLELEKRAKCRTLKKQ